MPLDGFTVGQEYEWTAALQQLGAHLQQRAVTVLPDGTLVLFLTEGHPQYVNWIEGGPVLRMEVNRQAQGINNLLAAGAGGPRIELFYRVARRGAAAPFTYRGGLSFLERPRPGNPAIMAFTLLGA